MPPTPGVSVALPIFRADAAHLRAAFASIGAQTLRTIDTLLVLNGADATTPRLARELAAGDPRARMLELPRANLASALNAALREARFDLVARMDADDTCRPERLARQVGFM